MRRVLSLARPCARICARLIAFLLAIRDVVRFDETRRFSLVKTLRFETKSHVFKALIS